MSEEKTYEMVRIQCGEHEVETYKFRANEEDFKKVTSFFHDKYEDDNINFRCLGGEKVYSAQELIGEFAKW